MITNFNARFLVACSIGVSVILALLFSSPAYRLLFRQRVQALSNLSFSTIATSSPPAKMGRMPTYFLSHGSPMIQYDTAHPIYSVLQKVGLEIKALKPKAVVIFSAHWQNSPAIAVNSVEHTPLVYDFYGFPKHYYEAKYPHVGSPEVARKVLGLLSAHGFAAEPAERGLDHGVWCHFTVAFDPEKNPLGVPIVQVSLQENEDLEAHYEIGRALESLRDEDIVIIGGGMTVHNLRDARTAFGKPGALEYAKSFEKALADATLTDPKARKDKMVAMDKRPDFRQAHPWADHLLPIYVAAGAASEAQATQLFTKAEGSMAWGSYRFGELPKEVAK